MRIILSSLLVILSFWSFSQDNIQATVKDAKTKEPLQYCNIVIKSSGKGTITNADGVFNISVDSAKDSLQFYYMGYEIKTISAVQLLQMNEIFLQKKDFEIQEITVYTDNDYLYEILKKCRKNLKNNKTEHVSKVYYGLETQSKGKPIELVECYYNGHFTGTNIDELRFKNGRTGHASKTENYFLTLNSSKAFTLINLTSQNGYFPFIPLQFAKRRMKRKFNLEMENQDENMYIINFSPYKNQQDYFSGKVWIEKGTFRLLKIDLSVENTNKHPFLPLFQFNSIHKVSFNISKAYKKIGNETVPEYINFKYSFKYKTDLDKAKTTAQLHNEIDRDISSKGIIYFYDFDKPFILPYFEYDNNFSDYRKMSFIPYNEIFWNNNNKLLLTEKQKENLGFFSQEGSLVNYREGNFGSNFLVLPIFDASFFLYKYYFWDATNRIQLVSDLHENKNNSRQLINNLSFQREFYNFKVQILLDICSLNDTLQCKSYTVFDQNQTYFHLPTDSSTNPFINIYFDIYEIERRKMQKKLNSEIFTIDQIDSYYELTLENLDKISEQYLDEVQMGKNQNSFEKWNKYILDRLGINNIEMFEKRDQE
ncbi:MAG: hypothetical protein HN704_15665 [Bacteroidetes bacterium]|jgi:hypothetical protein|nr:hypothetical protein [Bacteroidota bacterium]MBT6687407.1 hypothetical protein [Bacteroidota bacterium]MBT7142318.1 hypothetical protein [Bacteroidota bacterium]MBT7493034.1 hypothetical protein [Bacteroidota bacterium]